MQLDKSDKAILKLLQTSGRISNVELAEKVFLSPPAVHARVKRLEQDGYIQRYVTLLNRKAMGRNGLCFINLSLQFHHHDKLEEVIDSILRMEEVLECHLLTGDSDYLLKVLVKDTHELEEFISKKLTPLPGIARIHTSVVLKEIKYTTEIATDDE